MIYHYNHLNVLTCSEKKTVGYSYFGQEERDRLQAPCHNKTYDMQSRKPHIPRPGGSVPPSARCSDCIWWVMRRFALRTGGAWALVEDVGGGVNALRDEAPAKTHTNHNYTQKYW